jgi:peptidylprolyl isomerase
LDIANVLTTDIGPDDSDTEAIQAAQGFAAAAEETILLNLYLDRRHQCCYKNRRPNSLGKEIPLEKKFILITAAAVLILIVGAAVSQGGREMVTPSGLKVELLQEGKGPLPQKGQKVVVHYTGTLADGKKFDSSRDRGEAFSFSLGMGQVIQGWDEGLTLMNVGSRAKLTIPPALGYGPRGAGNVIPPNAVLIFDVELLDAK